MNDQLNESPAERLSRHSREAEAQGGSESDLRHHLWLVLQPWAKDALGLDQGALKNEGVGAAGRFDSRIGRSIIEYKTPGHLSSNAHRNTAASQALSYVNDPTMGADVVIITDGTVWAHYRDASAEPEPGEQSWLDFGGPLPSEPVKRFSWRDNSPESCERILALIETVRTAPISSAAVAGRLGPGRTEVDSVITELAAELAGRTANDRGDTLFQQWILMAGVSYGIEAANDPWPAPPLKLLGPGLATALGTSTYAEALFTLHTYVALASKLIGTELLSLATGNHQHRPTEWSSLPDDQLRDRFRLLESGDLAAEMHAPNLLAGDLFGWYAHGLSNNLTPHLRRILVALGELAWARIANSARGVAGDLLRDFYAAVLPRPLRRALGEFFTPQWLAERTLARAVELGGFNGKSARVLDPACGSGTFLVAALHRELIAQDAIHADQPAVATRNALERVVGFDINPVAVLMSRINMLLALGDRVQHLTTVEPRVYETDSILLPDVVTGQQQLGSGADFRRVPLSIGDVDVPGPLATHRGLRALRDNVEAGVENDRSDIEAIRGTAPPDDDTLDAAERIIEQAFAPATLEPADLVVGNPPWINWKHLPDPWQARSEAVWRGWGLWATKTRGGGIPLADISTLLLARSIVTYAKPGGIVGFLLPESLLTADPGNERFRRCHLRPEVADSLHPVAGVQFNPVGVDDWTAIKPFSPDAANLPIGLYVMAAVAPAFPVVKRTWTRKTPRSRIPTGSHWGHVRSDLVAADTSIAPVEAGNLWSPWASIGGLPLLPKADPLIAYTWGQGFHSHGLDGLLIVDVLSAGPAPDGLVIVENVPNAGDNTRGETPRRGVVEAEFLWPLVRGSDVNPFTVASSGRYAILAHDPSNLNRVLTVDEIVRKAPNLSDFLEPWIPRLASRFKYGKLSPSLDQPWGVRGPTERLTRATPVVLCRYMHPAKKPPAAVYLPTFDERTGITTTCYPNNKSNVHIPAGGAREAHYLTGWVNSEPAQSAIARMASSTTIGPTTLHRLPIPRFDPTDPVHAAIADLAQAAASGELVGPNELSALVKATLG